MKITREVIKEGYSKGDTLVTYSYDWFGTPTTAITYEVRTTKPGKKGGRPKKCIHEWVDHWDAKTPELICSQCEETKPKS